MTNSKQWLCYLHIKCHGSVSRMINYYDCLVFSVNYLWRFSFDALFYTHQPLCITECWKTSICQYLNVTLVPHSITCLRILKNKKCFTKVVPPSRFNVCFRGVLASVHEQQLHSLEALVKFFMWSIFTL